jgi:hypothetical protein
VTELHTRAGNMDQGGPASFFLVSWSSSVQGPGPCFLFSKQTHTFWLVTGGVIWRSINVGFLNLTVYSLQGSFPPRFERFYPDFGSAGCPFLGVNLSTFAA